MKLAQPWPVAPSMTYDEVSMEHSKNFVNALQELKNLKPQLYSAAEYCEKSYLHSEQKQMVFGNLKDYAVRALVNAVDHLGTVAFKLNELLDQKINDVSAMELDVSFLNQRLITCQTYTEKEGMRQQQFFSIIPRHHKHYVLPSEPKKVHFSPQIQAHTRQSCNSETRSQIFCPSGTPASKTLSWHLAAETKSTLEGTNDVALRNGDTNTSVQISGVFNLSRNDDEKNIQTKSSTSQTIGALRKQDLAVEGSKNLIASKSVDPKKKEVVDSQMIRNKSMLSIFFPKHKGSRVRKFVS